jgi:hypothetical protein
LTVVYREEELLATRVPLIEIPIRQDHYSEILALFKKAMGPITSGRNLTSNSVSTRTPMCVHEKLCL